MINIAICDDDFNFLNNFSVIAKSCFIKYNKKINLELFTNGIDLIESIEKKKNVFDIVFLDLEMPIIDGFSTATRLRELNNELHLIFITNLANESIKGYKYQAFRFILKSNLIIDLDEAIYNILNYYCENSVQEEFVNFKFRYENFFDTIKIQKKDLLFLELKNRRVKLVSHYGEYDLLVKTLNNYKLMLSSDNFIVISRSYLINLDNIKDVKLEYIYMENNYKICIGHSKTALKNFKKKYMLYKSERVYLK